MQDRMAGAIKRLIDLVVAVVVLILFTPFFIIIIPVIRVKDGEGAIFKHCRVGKGERRFMLYKLRTMNNQRDIEGKLLPDAERLTGLGKWLRQMSLDELPQMYNVLKGEMSMVGPRPLLEQYLPLYNSRQKKRHLVKPGITGWAQVNGRNAISWEEKFEFDVWYVENWSLGLDIKIMWMTVGKIFKREGISAGAHATMPFFTGTPGEKDRNG